MSFSISDISYRFADNVVYETDIEYRKMISHIFQLNVNKETYFGDATTGIMTYPDKLFSEDDFNYEQIECIAMKIYKNIEKDPLMSNLFERAAAKLMSTDKEKGLIILFSYNAFDLFHECLRIFLYFPQQWNEDTPVYKQLLERLKKNKNNI